MNRSVTLAAWILVSFLCVAEVKAASNEAAATPQTQQGETNVDQQGQSDAPTTPAAALFWQAREKARYENKVRAEALRNQEVSKETGQGSTTAGGKSAKKKQGKSNSGTK